MTNERPILRSAWRKPYLFARALRQPYYVFRPGQLARRISLSLRGGSLPEMTDALLPWGPPIRVRTRDHIGHSILVCGLYDLGVCETLWRLLEPGEAALDIGANIGQMTSLMAARIGGGGSVSSFEPHPDVFADLCQNVSGWARLPCMARIVARQEALSDRVGAADLSIPDDFAKNRGTASLETAQSRMGSYRVATNTLDEVLSGGQTIGVAKLDVEGHEAQVLAGGSAALGAGRIRDIVFEEFHPYPGAVTRLLESFGYVVLAIRSGFWGIEAMPPNGSSRNGHDDPPIYLGTKDPNRARQLLRPWGWNCLRTCCPSA